MELQFSLRFFGEHLFQEFAGVGDAVGTFPENFSCAHSFEKPTNGGSVAVLERGDDAFHAADGDVPVLMDHSQHHSGSDEGSAGAFHVSHTGGVGSGDILARLFVQTRKVRICAKDGLGAVVGERPLLFGGDILP